MGARSNYNPAEVLEEAQGGEKIHFQAMGDELKGSDSKVVELHLLKKSYNYKF